ncbi:hypothetical protein RSOL_276320, partial [Rhizoctonia solani AG-3 Rhs1AP]
MPQQWHPVPHPPLGLAGELEPTIKDIYQLLQHLNIKVTKLQEDFANLENVVIDQDSTLSAVKKQTKDRIALANGTQNMLSWLEEQVRTIHPTTPDNNTARPDVDPMPRAAPSCPKVRISSPSRTSRSPETKPLHGSQYNPTFRLFGARPLRSPSPPASSYTPTATPRPAAPKIKEPDAFDGTRGKAAKDWFLQSYITDFENICSDLDWNEAAYQATFKKGLHWKVKELLSQVYPAPSTFEEIKTHARHIDATRQENEASQPKRDNAPKKSTTPAVTSTKTTTTTSKTCLEDWDNYVSPEE